MALLACGCGLSERHIPRTGSAGTFGCAPTLDPGGTEYDGEQLSRLVGVTHITHGLTLTGVFTGDLSALDCLEEVDGDLDITQTSGLTSFEDLDNLVHVGGTLSIIDNPDLVSVGNLTQLSSIGRGLDIFSNPGLTAVDGLPGLTSLGGGLRVYYNDALQTVDLPSLLSAAGVEVMVNEALVSFGAPSLTELDTLFFASNGRDAASTELDLSGLESARSMQIYDNEHWQLGAGLASLAYVGDELGISDNAELTSVDLGALTFAHVLAFARNPSLLSLDGLTALTDAGALFINSNPSLASVHLPLLKELGYGLTFFENGSCSTCTARFELESLTTVHGPVSLYDNARWDFGSGLSSLSVIDGILQIFNNQDPDFTLSSLTSVGDDLVVTTNPALTTLAFPLLTDLGSGLVIEDNPLLPTCQATGVLDRLLTNGFDHGIHIDGNLADACTE